MSYLQVLKRSFLVLCILLCGYTDTLQSNEKFLAFTPVSTREELDNCKRIAKEQAVPLLVVFLGSGWCPWSEKIENEIFSDAKFTEILQGKCCLVKIEMPTQASSDPSFTAVQELTSEYDIKESPTLLLLSKEGEVIAKEGYFPFEPAAFAKHLKESFDTFNEIKEKLQTQPLSEALLEELHQKARTLGFHGLQEEIVNQGITIGKEPFFFLEKFERLVKLRKKKDPEVHALRKKILSLDPKNVKKAHLRLAMIDFVNRSEHKKTKKEPKVVVDPLISYVKQFGKGDRENLWKIEMMIAQYLFSKKETHLAVKHAERSLEAAPEVVRSDVMETLAYLKETASKNK